MDKKEFILIVAIGGIVTIESIALVCGINGHALMASIAALGTVFGIVLGRKMKE